VTELQTLQTLTPLASHPVRMPGRPDPEVARASPRSMGLTMSQCRAVTKTRACRSLARPRGPRPADAGASVDLCQLLAPAHYCPRPRCASSGQGLVLHALLQAHVHMSPTWLYF